MISADTNLFLYAANSASPNHQAAKQFFASMGTEFVVCELVLIEIYMLLRNPAILQTPLSSSKSAGFCKTLRTHPKWQHIDYEPSVAPKLWNWAEKSRKGFRKIIDARLALTLLEHGVTEFATANVKDFEEFGFERVWTPL
jgi:toxin-antitoxin system PIN domain toxin